MSRVTIFEESFLVSGIMCFDGCGNSIQNALSQCISDCIKKKVLPSDASFILDTEPHGFGIHKLVITIESAERECLPAEPAHTIVSDKIKDLGFDVVEDLEETIARKSKWTNLINIVINLVSMGMVISGALLFPPSILVTLGLTALSFVTTAYTSRAYLLTFFRNFRSKNFANMATTISLGWFLSLAHTLYHAITMPVVASFSMLFMSFIMPLMLITCINGMDEIKRLVMEKSQKIQLKGIKRLFPQLSDTYRYYELTQEESSKIDHFKTKQNPSAALYEGGEKEKESLSFIENILATSQSRLKKKSLLKEKMLIEVQQDACFPVDCILVKGSTVIDGSLLTGESQQRKQCWQTIPAGAINLGGKVIVYAEKDVYNSTINRLLFPSNRLRNPNVPEKGIPKFAYSYAALILVGIVGSIVIPAALGVITVSLVMQNVIGILFSLCFCTVAIAHELPKLISLHYRNQKGICLRDDSLIDTDSSEIHTVVFDKTGTLTTGNSVVESTDIPSNSPLWQRIYLLEKAHGRGHPLAKAIQTYYETEKNAQSLFNEVEIKDEKNDGLTAIVQGKKLCIGSYHYLKNNHISLPELDELKITQGFSAVYVAEEGIYSGVIYIRHAVRPGAIETLNRLKREGKKIIMLTGDNHLSARGFNQQLHAIFDEKDIQAEQTPQDKETFLKHLMDESGVNPKGVWFCGDGLNDAPCCRVVSEKGGVSCAMSPNDKSAFFTDISLNGSFDYLFKHKELNRALKLIIAQNKGILIYSTLAFLSFIISFSIVGIAVSPLIPMVIMLSTTLSILFNSYRTQFIIDYALDAFTSWPKKFLSSNISLAIVFLASTLLICSVLVTTISTGGLALPIIAFTVGAATTFSSVCTLIAFGLMSTLGVLLMISLVSPKNDPEEPDATISPKALPTSVTEEIKISERSSYKRFFSSRPHSGEELNKVFNCTLT